VIPPEAVVGVPDQVLTFLVDLVVITVPAIIVAELFVYTPHQRGLAF
jgi:hypothetical protein